MSSGRGATMAPVGDNDSSRIGDEGGGRLGVS